MGQGHSIHTADGLKRSKSRQSTRSLNAVTIDRVKKTKSMAANDTKVVYDGNSRKQNMDAIWYQDSAPYHMPSKVKVTNGPVSLPGHRYIGNDEHDWSDVASDLFRCKRKTDEVRSKRNSSRRSSKASTLTHNNLQSSPGDSLRRRRSSKYDTEIAPNASAMSSSHSVHESVSSYAPRRSKCKPPPPKSSSSYHELTDPNGSCSFTSTSTTNSSPCRPPRVESSTMPPPPRPPKPSSSVDNHQFNDFPHAFMHPQAPLGGTASLSQVQQSPALPASPTESSGSQCNKLTIQCLRDELSEERALRLEAERRAEKGIKQVKQIEKRMAEISVREGGNAALQSRVSQLENQVQHAEKEKKGLTVQLDKHRKEYERHMDDITTRVASALMEQKNLHEQNTTLLNRVRELELDNRILKKQMQLSDCRDNNRTVDNSHLTAESPSFFIRKQCMLGMRKGVGSDPSLVMTSVDLQTYSSGDSCSNSSMAHFQPSLDASPISTAGEVLCSRPNSFLIDPPERSYSTNTTASAVIAAAFKNVQMRTPPNENMNDDEDEDEDEKPRNYASSKGDGEDGKPSFGSLRLPLAHSFKGSPIQTGQWAAPRMNIPPRDEDTQSGIEGLRKSGHSNSSLRSTTTTVHNFMKGSEDLLEKDDEYEDDEQSTSTPKASPENAGRNLSMDADGSLTPTPASMSNFVPLDLSAVSVEAEKDVECASERSLEWDTLLTSSPSKLPQPPLSCTSSGVSSGGPHLLWDMEFDSLVDHQLRRTQSLTNVLDDGRCARLSQRRWASEGGDSEHSPNQELITDRLNSDDQSRMFHSKYYNLCTPAKPVLPANTSSSFSDDSDDDGATTVHLWIKQLKRGKQGLVRYSPPTWRPCITKTNRIFARFGAPERDALACFDFLTEMNTSATYKPGASVEQLAMCNRTVRMRPNCKTSAGSKRRSRSLTELQKPLCEDDCTIYHNVPVAIRRSRRVSSSSSSSQGELDVGLGGEDWWRPDSSCSSSGQSFAGSANSSLMLSEMGTRPVSSSSSLSCT